MIEVTDEMLKVARSMQSFELMIKRIIELHEQSKPKHEPVAYKICNPAGCVLVESKRQAEKLASEYGDGTYQPLYTAPPTQALQHSDDLAVDQFAQALKDKMRKSREKGRSGWDDKQQCPNGRLQQMLIDHLGKGDPLDVGAFAMMLFIRGERTNPPTREPLSEEEIEKLVPWQGDPKDPFFNRVEFARAIEQYHGIGTPHEPT